jgi:hypothetical protein
MSKAKSEESRSQTILAKPPPQGFSKFGKVPQFGFSKFSAPKAQFKPPTPRITQNKGGGGK